MDFLRRGVYNLQRFQFLLNNSGILIQFRLNGSHAWDGDPAERGGIACGYDKGKQRQEEKQNPTGFEDHNVTLL